MENTLVFCGGFQAGGFVVTTFLLVGDLCIYRGANNFVIDFALANQAVLPRALQVCRSGCLLASARV
jgi:hypothetical protein